MAETQTKNFDAVRTKILPQIRPIESLRRENVVLPFVNDTGILYVIQENALPTPLTNELIDKWRIDIWEIDQLARENLVKMNPELEMDLYKSHDVAAGIFRADDGYDASRLLLNNLHCKLVAELGGDFLVGIPTSDVFIAMQYNKEFVAKIRSRIEEDFRTLPNPITRKLFFVTMDGIAPDPGDLI